MSYNKDFYKQYKKYLKEKRVRHVHDKVFGLFYKFMEDREENPNILDLGCGQCQEFCCNDSNSDKRGFYIGFDVNIEENKDEDEEDLETFFGSYCFRLNYRDENFVKSAKEIYHKICQPSDWESDCFVSLFSTEITASAEENQTLYERLFKEIPTLRYGLVSGFYYSSKKDKVVIEETGGITSWQTLDSIEDRNSDKFSEMRIYVPCPSKMFGEDVIEVWRILERKK